MSDPNEQPQSDPPAQGNPGEVPQNQRTMGMLCHLLSFCGLLGIPGGNILGPLIFWLIYKNTIPFVDDQGKESINFQITVMIVVVCLGVLSLVPFAACITIPLLIGVLIACLVFVVIGLLKANEGQYYRYPVNIRLVK